MNALPAVFADRHRGPVLAMIAASGIVQAIAAGAAALAMRDIFAALRTDTHLHAVLVVTVLGAGMLIAGLRLADRATGEYAGQHFAAALRQKLFLHLAKLPVTELTRHRTGSIAVRFIGDLSAIRIWVSLGVARVISSAVVIPGALIALWILNPAFALICAGVLLIAFALMALLQVKLRPVHRKLRRLRGKIAADMNERIPVASELRIQGRIPKEATRLNRRTHQLRKAAVERSVVSGIVRAIPEISLSCISAMFLVAAFQLQISVADLAASLAMLGILLTPLSQLGAIADHYRAWEIARDKCVALLDIPEMHNLVSREKDSPRLGLNFHNVTAGKFKKLNTAVSPGEFIAVVGPNGAGKSTLLSLIAGLEQPTTGRIAFNGRTLRSEDLCYVGARSPILKGSLRRALTMGMKKRPADSVIEECAVKFGLSSLLKRLSGLDGLVNESGANLSSGEARRVHLTRAALACPKVLLLDEPDDALDPGGWSLVVKLIRETGATSICVTHNLALAGMADRVWFVADGELLASESLQQLLRAPGPARQFITPDELRNAGAM